MNHSRHRNSVLKSCAAVLLVLVLSFPAGCGNNDFQRPIQQFQSASAVVISAARQSLQQMNDVEEKSELDRQIFEAEAFDESTIKAKDVISADELNARVNALDQLTRYTSALADLAALKAPAQVTQKFQDVNRKSTRLNSCHTGSAIAVFVFKNKSELTRYDMPV